MDTSLIMLYFVVEMLHVMGEGRIAAVSMGVVYFIFNFIGVT